MGLAEDRVVSSGPAKEGAFDGSGRSRWSGAPSPPFSFPQSNLDKESAVAPPLGAGTTRSATICFGGRCGRRQAEWDDEDDNNNDNDKTTTTTMTTPRWHRRVPRRAPRVMEAPPGAGGGATSEAAAMSRSD